jgi:hypothetical protein
VQVERHVWWGLETALTLTIRVLYAIDVSFFEKRKLH